MQNTVSHNYTDLLHKETKDFMITLLIKISILYMHQPYWVVRNSQIIIGRYFIIKISYITLKLPN